MNRRTVSVLTAGALLVALAPPVAAAQGATQGREYGRRELQRDVDAIRAAGATGVLAEVRTERDASVARAGVADLKTRRPVPWNSYYRLGRLVDNAICAAATG